MTIVGFRSQSHSYRAGIQTLQPNIFSMAPGQTTPDNTNFVWNSFAHHEKPSISSTIVLCRLSPHQPAPKGLSLGLYSISSLSVQMAGQTECLYDFCHIDLIFVIERNFSKESAQGNRAQLYVRLCKVVCTGEYIVGGGSGYEVPTIR